MAKYGKHVIAIIVMGTIIAILLMLFTPRSTSRSSALEQALPPQSSAPKP